MITTAVLFHKQLRHMARANRLQESAVKNQYFQQLRDWADEACDVLSAACHLCDVDNSNEDPSKWRERHDALCVKLFSLRNRGRWSFLNQERESGDEDRLGGATSHRDDALDSLVEAYELLESFEGDPKEQRAKLH